MNGSGLGGGVLRFSVDTMIVDGTVTAGGMSGTSDRGGGSGGSIYLVVKDFEGHGVVQVRNCDKYFFIYRG